MSLFELRSMSGRHSVTKSQLFASPGVVIRKSVILKQPRNPVDESTHRSSVDANSRLPSVEDDESVMCSSEGI